MVTGDFAPGGPAKYQIRDTGAALDAAAGAGLDLPLAAAVDRLFRSLVAHGGADLDHSALILELKRANGLATAIPSPAAGCGRGPAAEAERP